MALFDPLILTPLSPATQFNRVIDAAGASGKTILAT
jgi:hypothetical protein